MKERVKNILIFILGITISITGSVIANTLIKSGDVIYDNAKSGLESTTVQGAVDELYSAATDYSSLATRVTALEENKFLDSHPVGSIYLTISENENTVAKMHNLYGGTWESYGQGRTLVGVGTNVDSQGDTLVFGKNENGGNYYHRHKSPLSWVNHDGNGYFGVTNAYSSYSDPNKDFYGIMVQYRFSSGEGENISNLGGYNTSFENSMMPYTTVYMYKRVN